MQTLVKRFYAYCTWCNEQSTSSIACPGDGWLRILIYCRNSNESENSLATLCLFPLDWHLWQDRKPSPDADVISLIESVQDTMPTLFQQIRGCEFLGFTLFSSSAIRPSRSQPSHKVVLCSCNVGLRPAGIQRCRSEATQQPADFLSPGQTEFTAPHMSGFVLSAVTFCLTGVGFSLLRLCATDRPLINSNSPFLHPSCAIWSVVSSWFSRSLFSYVEVSGNQ